MQIAGEIVAERASTDAVATERPLVGGLHEVVDLAAPVRRFRDIARSVLQPPHDVRHLAGLAALVAEEVAGGRLHFRHAQKREVEHGVAPHGAVISVEAVPRPPGLGTGHRVQHAPARGEPASDLCRGRGSARREPVVAGIGGADGRCHVHGGGRPERLVQGEGLDTVRCAGSRSTEAGGSGVVTKDPSFGRDVHPAELLGHTGEIEHEHPWIGGRDVIGSEEVVRPRVGEEFRVRNRPVAGATDLLAGLDDHGQSPAGEHPGAQFQGRRRVELAVGVV